MKATKLLETQHRKVEALFIKLESGALDPQPLLSELADSLVAHMAIEQQIFYPAVRALSEDLVAESFEEHAIAELALKRLMDTAPADPSFFAKLSVLKALIGHHIAEEEGDLFPLVERKVGPSELEALGRSMKAAFDGAVARGFEELVPHSMSATSADLANSTGPSELFSRNEGFRPSAPSSH